MAGFRNETKQEIYALNRNSGFADFKRRWHTAEEGYLHDEFKSTSYISVAADNYHNVDIANSHVKEWTTTNLAHRAGTELFCLHDMHAESVHHISPRRNYSSE